MLLFFVFFALFLVFGAGILYFSADVVDSSFTAIGDLSIGGIDFNQTYQNTLGIGISASKNTITTASIGLLLGMVVVMMLMGYFLRGTNRLWIILDLFIILVAFITAVYLSRSFDTFINLNSDLFSIFSNDLETSSRFVLNLPFVIPIIGVLIMLVTYATGRKKEEPNVLSFQ